MGTEAAALGIAAGSALYGASQARSSAQTAKRESRNFFNSQEQTRQKVAQEQSILAKKVEQQQRKVAAAQARSNRSRLRGGVFGESEPTTRALNPTLG